MVVVLGFRTQKWVWGVWGARWVESSRGFRGFGGCLAGFPFSGLLNSSLPTTMKQNFVDPTERHLVVVENRSEAIIIYSDARLSLKRSLAPNSGHLHHAVDRHRWRMVNQRWAELSSTCYTNRYIDTPHFSLIHQHHGVLVSDCGRSNL